MRQHDDITKFVPSHWSIMIIPELFVDLPGFGATLRKTPWTAPFSFVLNINQNIQDCSWMFTLILFRHNYLCGRFVDARKFLYVDNVLPEYVIY